MEILKEPDFTPKTHINDYLNELNAYFSDEFTSKEAPNSVGRVDFLDQYLNGYPNISIYKDLTEGENLGLWEPLDFFNQLYEQIERIRINKEKPYSVVEYLLDLPLKEKKKLYLLDHICRRIENESGYTVRKAVKDQKLFFISKFLREKKTELGLKLFPDEYTFEINIEPSPAPPWIPPWSEVAKQIETAIPDAESKIRYLINIRTQYQQEYPNSDENSVFVKCCNLEINKIQEFSEIKIKRPEGSSTQDVMSFKLSKNVTKIDLIRVLNTLWELRFVELKKDGQLPSKRIFMEESGKFFGVDLSKYDSDLSQALRNGSMENNLKIFEEMKKVIQREISK